MAGSKQNFIYKSDPDNLGEVLAKIVKLDESNTRALGYVPITVAEVAAIPDKRVKALDGTERYVSCQGITTGGKIVTRRIVIPEVDNGLFQSGGTIVLPVLTGGANATVENVVFTVTSSVGETKSFARVGDTGLDDGTADAPV